MISLLPQKRKFVKLSVLRHLNLVIRILYLDFKETSSPATRIVNLSLESAVFPSCFKSALVTPLLKKTIARCRNFKKQPACV